MVPRGTPLIFSEQVPMVNAPPLINFTSANSLHPHRVHQLSLYFFGFAYITIHNCSNVLRRLSTLTNPLFPNLS